MSRERTEVGRAAGRPYILRHLRWETEFPCMHGEPGGRSWAWFLTLPADPEDGHVGGFHARRDALEYLATANSAPPAGIRPG